jgi:outer membrane protein assembly factor BamB
MATASGNVLRVDADTGEVTSQFTLGVGPLSSPPIAVDGWLYAGNREGAMVAFDTGAPELTGWEMLGGGPGRQGAREGEGS